MPTEQPTNEEQSAERSRASSASKQDVAGADSTMQTPVKAGAGR